MAIKKTPDTTTYSLTADTLIDGDVFQAGAQIELTADEFAHFKARLIVPVSGSTAGGM